MMKYLQRTATALLLLFTAGCASNQIPLGEPWQLPEPSGPDDALIIGHVVIGPKESRSVPDLVRIFRKDKIYVGMGQKGIGEPHHVFSDGRFVVRVKPGSFHFNSLYANNTIFQVATDAKKVEWFTVGPGQVYYLGSFHVKPTKAEKMWRPGEFDIVRVSQPSRQELHRWLTTIAIGTGWETRVRTQAR